MGFRILNSFDETLDIAGSVLAHHEYWDGSGYPKGLKGQEIPFLARIIAAAEYYDTLLQRTSDTDKIAEELMAQAGKKLDPQLVSVLLEMNRTRHGDGAFGWFVFLCIFLFEKIHNHPYNVYCNDLALYFFYANLRN